MIKIVFNFKCIHWYLRVWIMLPTPNSSMSQISFLSLNLWMVCVIQFEPPK